MNWRLSLSEAIKFQERNRRKLILEPLTQDFRLICGVDAAFSDNKVYAVACVFKGKSRYENFNSFDNPDRYSDSSLKLIEEAQVVQEVNYPYIPGFFAWREGSALVEAIKKLNKKPDVILVDGHGIAHPRGFGIASHIGYLLQIPTIGCAKTKLVGEYEEPGLESGAWSPLVVKLDKSRGGDTSLTLRMTKKVGAVVRTKTGVKPIFVSPGNLIDLETSIRVILASSKYRIPEPLRIANMRSKELKINAKFQNPNIK